MLKHLDIAQAYSTLSRIHGLFVPLPLPIKFHDLVKCLTLLYTYPTYFSWPYSSYYVLKRPVSNLSVSNLSVYPSISGKTSRRCQIQKDTFKLEIRKQRSKELTEKLTIEKIASPKVRQL